MQERRPIDAIRDSALQMEIGVATDGSAIKEFCVIGGSLHVIKTNAIHRIQLADEIDPLRTNPALPNTHQQIIPYGTENEYVRQTLLTAKRLFGSKFLSESFDYAKAIDLSFEALKDIIAMHEMKSNLISKLENISTDLDRLTPKDRALAVPAVGGLTVLIESFVQRADHMHVDLFEIVKLFYPNKLGKRLFEALLSEVAKKHGADAPFATFLASVLPFLKLVRNARNCSEHPKPDKRIEVFDVTLLPTGMLRPPSLEIIHPDTPQQMIAIADFMSMSIEQLATIFEVMLAFLCGYNMQPLGGFNFQVVRYPADLEKAFGVRFGYGTYDGDRIIPCG